MTLAGLQQGGEIIRATLAGLQQGGETIHVTLATPARRGNCYCDSGHSSKERKLLG